MDLYKELMREKMREREVEDATKDAALAGSAYGAIGGGLGSILSGQRSIPRVIANSLLGAAGSAALSGGAIYGGSKLMGPPTDEEDSGFTTRGALGGGLGGLLTGAGIGGLLGAGKLKFLAKPASKIVGEEAGLFNNLITDKLKEWARSPSRGNATKAAALLGGGAGAAGSYWGSGEGMTLDALRGYEDEDEHLR